MVDDEALRQRIEDARAALKRIRRGEGPTAEELAAAPQLECWYVTRHYDCVALGGYVTGHPTLRDGDHIVTSCLLWISDKCDAARTVSRYYRLTNSLEDLLARRQ
jgi:hypothetical protein